MDWLQEFLAVAKLDQVALAGIVTLGIIWVFVGKLVPKSTVDDVRSERDAWKAAYLTEARAGAVKDGQISELMELARTGTHALASLPGGDTHVGKTSPAPRTR